MDDDSEDKKAKGTKKFVIKRKGKFENYKNCLKATQLENEISYSEKSKINKNSIKDFLENNKTIIKIQQRFKSERNNNFTEEIIKIDLSSDYDKRMQSTDLIEIYAYGTSKDLVSNKEEIK